MKLPRAHLRVIEPGPGPHGEPPRSLAGRRPLPEQLRRESIAERAEVSLWLGLYRAIAWVDSKIRRKR